MVTGSSYEETPDFVQNTKSWSSRLQEWLNRRGAAFLLVGRDIDQVPQGVAHIAIGLAQSGHTHAVVVTDRVIDPGIFNRPLAAEPKHRLVILPIAR